MSEVALGHYAGPYKEPTYEHFIQSPIGLVPKSGSKVKTRLIFHLSYDFGTEDNQCSFNYHTPDEICSVKYRDLDHAVANCLRLIHEYCHQTGQSEDSCTIFFAKIDLTSAFRQLPG